ncbi:MAG: efflux RND transporter periplasmic adaptor subunit [Burkholderiales bacterium]|nr:efflux RND transporter periplasmic adaptor subunit [Burkholderiales bacterium]
MALHRWSSILGHAAWGLVLALPLPAAATAPAAALASVTVKSGGNGESSGFDGVVEALRQTVIAAQVQGAVIALTVKAGDAVRAGQVLVRLDARAALQNAAAGDAQVRAARAEMEAATREVERQRALFARQYISQAALDRAEAQFKSTTAIVESQVAQANAARTQSGFYVLSAPYSGVIAEVSVVQGDMAMPGRPLMTIYDPAAMRVTAPLPQSLAARLGGADAMRTTRIELPGLPAERSQQAPTRVTILPAADPATHTVPVRFDLGASLPVAPGSFARVWLPAGNGSQARVFVPSSSLVQRAEVTAVYVLDAGGKPHLRQVRLGRANGGMTEVLAGVSDGERVATDPQAAARVR